MDSNKNFNVDSTSWIAIWYPPAIITPKDDYLVRYNKSRYLINKTIVEQGIIAKPQGKTKRIYQEYELTLEYILFPSLFLWNPNGNIVKIAENTDLYMRLRE